MLLLSGIIFSILSYAQKCRFQFDKEDPVTGERVVRTGVSLSMWTKFQFYRSDDDLRIEYYAMLGGEHNFSVPPGAIMKIRLGNDEILEVKSVNKAVPTSSIVSNRVVTSYGFSYEITIEQMKTIGNAGIKAISVSFNKDIRRTHEFKKRKNKKIKKYARCISSI